MKKNIFYFQPRGYGKAYYESHKKKYIDFTWFFLSNQILIILGGMFVYYFNIDVPWISLVGSFILTIINFVYSCLIESWYYKHD